MTNLKVVVITVCVTMAAARADKVQIDVRDVMLGKLAEAAKCSDKASPWRSWCIATQWSTGKAGELPKGKVLVGTTIQLEDGYDVGKALSERVSFVALAIDASGKVKLTDVKPESADEQKAVAEAIFNTAAVLKGKAKTAKLPKQLAGYLRTLKGSYDVNVTSGAWTWQGASRSQLRRVGDFWVVIEKPAKGNGVFATVLTDAWE